MMDAPRIISPSTASDSWGESICRCFPRVAKPWNPPFRGPPGGQLLAASWLHPKISHLFEIQCTVVCKENNPGYCKCMGQYDQPEWRYPHTLKTLIPWLLH